MMSILPFCFTISVMFFYSAVLHPHRLVLLTRCLLYGTLPKPYSHGQCSLPSVFGESCPWQLPRAVGMLLCSS